MKRDAKNVLKSMIEKAFEADQEKLNGDDLFQQIHDKRVNAFCDLLARDPRKYLTFSTSERITDESEVFDSSDFFMSAAGVAAVDKIVKQYPLPDEGNSKKSIKIASLDLTLYNVPSKLRAKYTKLGEQIDISVVSGDAADLYAILKKALA